MGRPRSVIHEPNIDTKRKEEQKKEGLEYGRAVGLVLGLLRRQRSLNQTQLGEITGICQGNLSRMEVTGTCFTLSNLVTLAKVYETTPSEMLKKAEGLLQNTWP
jgi:DNA-binding Xre family transcriptional regulator